MGLIQDLVGGGIKGIGDAAKGVIDAINAPKEEKDRALAGIQAEVNRHQEALQSQENEIIKALLADTASARSRETEFVKATGHTDWMMTTIGLLVMICFIGTVYFVATKKMPEGSEHLLINAMGILEGMVLSVVGYYFGSSAGSRIKDMKK